MLPTDAHKYCKIHAHVKKLVSIRTAQVDPECKSRVLIEKDEHGNCKHGWGGSPLITKHIRNTCLSYEDFPKHTPTLPM